VITRRAASTCKMEDFLTDLWERFSTGWDSARRESALWIPNRTGAGWLAPAVALGALLALVLLSGIAVLSLGLLLTALLTAYLILENVLGISIEVKAPTAR